MVVLRKHLMRRLLAIICFLLLTLAWALTDQSVSYAGIKNEGSETVVVLATKENGSAQATIFPNQTVPIPDKAKSIKVLPPTSMRGDEKTKVRIVQNNGVVLYLNKIGESVNLYEPQPEIALDVEYRKVTNLGNLAVNVIVYKKGGASETTSLLALQSMILHENAEEIEIAPQGSLRGDEQVDIEVVLLSGVTKKLESFGSRVRLDEVEE